MKYKNETIERIIKALMSDKRLTMTDLNTACDMLQTLLEPETERTLTSDELINEIAEVLREGDGEFIESIANQVLVGEIVYKEDSIFVQSLPHI